MGRLAWAAKAAAGLCALVFAASADAAGSSRTFMTAAHENGNGTVTLPLYRGLSNGRTVYFTVLDASTSAGASRYGVNRSNKLANAANTVAVQRVTMRNGVIDFPATVDFAPEHVIIPGATGFPPAAFAPGAVGQPGYSPLIQLPDGTILNAPQLANDTGRADKIVSMDTAGGHVVYQETAGYANGAHVMYVSTDASDALAAALEDATFAPQLNFAPGLGNDGTDSSRATLVATTNGQTGANNPNRQGFTSALLDGLSPLNVLAWTPNQGRYSPVWDVHIGTWTASAVAAHANVAIKNVSNVNTSLVTAPDGGAFGASNIVVDCPIVSQQ